MKSKVIGVLAIVMFAIMLSVTNVSAADTVTGSAIAIDETNFPDKVFREYVSTEFDADSDGCLSEEEVAEIRKISVENTGVTDLTGLEYFANISKLDCYNNSELKSLNVSENTALKELDCRNTGITKLDVSKNTSITLLKCQDTFIEELDISKNTALKNLYCSNTKITELDISKNIALSRLYCAGIKITELDVSTNTELTRLDCSDTDITKLDISNNIALVELICDSNGLEELDVSNNVVLERLSCNNNELTSLDVSKNTALKKLQCSDNKLTSIDLSANTAIETLSARSYRYNIGEISCMYDLSNIEGLDLTKTSGWLNATYAEGKLTEFTTKGNVTDITIYYTYDCGNDKTVQFGIVGTYTGEHNYTDGICVCGKKEGFYEINKDESFVYLEGERLDTNGPLSMNTYTFYDKNDEVVAVLEARFGGNYIMQGWVTSDGTTTTLSEDRKSFWSNALGVNGIIIGKELWNNSFGSSIESFTVTSELIPELDVDFDVVWDETSKPGVAIWNKIKDENIENYYVKLVCAGRTLVTANIKANLPCKFDFSTHIEESGVYTVEVTAVGNKNSSIKTVVSEPFVYEKPKEEVGAPIKVWWTAKEGETLPTIINWTPVAGANGYSVKLISSAESIRPITQIAYNDVNGFKTHRDFTNIIKAWNEQSGEELTYTCQVQSLSGDITVVAHASDDNLITSGDYVLAETVEEEIKEAFKEVTADNVINGIENAGVDNLADVMQNNEEVLGKVENLEKNFANNKAIEVLPPAVEHSDIETDSEIKVVGAGLNANGGSSIRLEFKDVDKNNKKDINTKLYEKSVQLDISLIEKEQKVEGKLKSPITITMRPPKGVDSDKLVILHYHNDEKLEHIHPKVNEDGTVTFSVTSFSTFAFANLVAYDEGISNTTLPDVTVTPDTGDDEPTIPDDSGENEPIEPSTPDDSDDDDDYTGGGSDDYEDRVYYTDVRDYVKSLWNGKEGWSRVDGKWYFFDNAGGLKSGWVQDTDSKWYYMDTEKASMVTGWVCSPESKLWYYMDNANGHMIENTWVLDNTTNRWYYLGSNGAMCTGWIFTDGAWYLLDKTGAMCTGWNMVDGHWYLMNEKGIMLTGWQTVDGKEYYLVESGECLVNTITPDGHKVDENGAKKE